ncbi:glycosyltransferase family 39 protein [Coleofasciculus sp. FACHB-501]|nr:glycosyltransferase family 39 protein [Coleofasciculus sp. FACHB-501]MBD1840256.1 glycosyltransferase family 39 protein [Coleofasciculus sp. FACHB-501]
MTHLKNIFFHLLILFLYVGFVLAIRPVQQAFEFDYDEGLNLIKALLYSQGFSLYTQIWNDQPPLFTVLLSYWFNIFGYSVFAARVLVILFSALLIWSFYQILGFSLGRIPALVATLFLVTSWLFLRLSISVMIGIPSLSLAMLSIYLITLYKQHRRRRFIILSGAVLAVSLQTKLFTVFLIPLMLFYILNFKLREPEESKSKDSFSTLVFSPLILWLIVLAVSYLGISLIFQAFNYEQLVQAHFGEKVQGQSTTFNNIENLPYFLYQDYDYVLFAFIGSLAILFKKQRAGIFPLIWLVTASLILLKHKPVWYHYYPLLAIPICWLAGYGVALVINLFPNGWNSNLKSLNFKKLIFPVLATALLIVSMIAIPAKPKGRPPKSLEVMNLVLKHKDSTQWIFTDRPIYAFYAGLPVPPEIAVMSDKRLKSGNLTFDEIIIVLKKYRPEQIVLARWIETFKSNSQFNTYIDENYSKTYQDDKGTVEHYLLKKSSS